MRAWPAALCLVALAGCAGGPAPVVTDTSSTDGIGVPAPPPPPVGSWESDDFEQDFTSIPQAAQGSTGAIFFITVPANATTAFFNVTVSATTVPDEFQVWFRDPENVDAGASGAPTAQMETAGGAGSVEVDAPLEGEWRVSILSKTAPNRAHVKVSVNAYVMG